uniref:Uncharacterized protein n=1 Tax=Pseudomonas fluorescens TaxID=294 RepID=A0A5E6VQT1_PSEFL|nr:hypothetical protein PS652_04277 [Pseudomonas fluorescens]
MNDALAQAGKELRAVDRLGAVGFGLRVTVVDEHQVQVRAVTQLDPADLAVADNNEARVAQAAIAALGLAVPAHGLAPGQGQHLVENGFGQPGQVVADFHQRQVAGDFRSGHAQAVGQLEVAQGFHLLFEVVLGDARQPLAQLGRQFRGLWRAEQPAFVEQFIEQQRETGDLFGDPWAGGAQGQQAAQRSRVFGEQHQVRRTPGDRFDQRQHPLQHQVRVGVLHRLGQQTWNKGIQTLTAQALHGPQLRADAQAGELFEGFLRVGETGVLQLTARGFFILGFFPQRQPFTADDHFTFFMLVFVRVGNHLTEVPVDPPTPVHQLRMETRPVGKTEHEGNAPAVQGIVREHLGLAVGNRLDCVFGVAQEFIAFAQLGNHRRWQVALAFEGRQHLEQWPLLQAQVAPAVNQLEGLGDELDFTDATSTQLDVIGHALAPHFLLDQLLHGAQRFDRREVQVTPVNEGPQHIQQLRASSLVARHYPRLDHRVAFPVAALILIILLQCIEAEHQGAGRAVRAQAHVDAEHETIDGDRVQGLDQALAQTGEELLVVQRALDPFGLATFGEGEDQVDVRRQVQLHRAQLAHAQHHHVLRLAAAMADRRAELLAMARVQPVVGLVDTRVGKVGQVAAGLHQVGLAGQVAPDDPHLLAAALATQVARQFVLALGRLAGGSDLLAQLARCEGPVEFTTGSQINQHRRVTYHLFKGKVTGRTDPGELRPALGTPVSNRQFRVLGNSRTKRLLVTADQGSEGGRQFGQQRQAHGLSLIGEIGLAASGLGNPDHGWTVIQKLEIAEKSDFMAETIAANLFLTCF